MTKWKVQDGSETYVIEGDYLAPAMRKFNGHEIYSIYDKNLKGETIPLECEIYNEKSKQSSRRTVFILKLKKEGE
jgi:hypothetical protein